MSIAPDTDNDLIPDCVDTDDDADGVPDLADRCTATSLPDRPTRHQLKNRYIATVDGFADGSGVVRYSLSEAGGCSGVQIIDALELGGGHRKFGLAKGALSRWIRLVAP